MSLNSKASLVAQKVKILPAMQGTYIQSLGREDPLQKEMATHSSYSCLENTKDRGAWQATVHEVSESWTRLRDYHSLIQFSSLQLLSHVRLFETPWTAAHQASLSITNSWTLLIHVHRVGDAIQPSHPLLSPSPPAFNRSQHQGLFK